MYEQIEKPKENKSRVVANSFTQKKRGGQQGFGVVDNRPKFFAQIISNKNRRKVTKKNSFVGDKNVVQQHRHLAQTYVVDITHRLANNGLPVQYYRDNVLGHQAQRGVIAAAMVAFARAYPATVGQGAPIRNGYSANGGAPAGAAQV